MKLFADTANIDELRELDEMGLICGVTTNPSIAASGGKDFAATLRSICELLPRYPVLGQVTETSAPEMIEQALRIREVHENIVVKLPATNEGLKAIASLKRRDVPVCATAVLTSAEALLCALAGADYVAPYVGEDDMIGFSGMDTLSEISAMFEASHISTQILAAAVLTPKGIVDAALAGADILTLTYATAMDVCRRPKPITDFYIGRFNHDWQGAGCFI